MKTEQNIFIAFILNLGFSIFEFIGGIFTGSIAIISDAVHDIGDAASIGISYFLEKKSQKQPDIIYTYGYGRYSVIGSVVTTAILLFGSVMVVCNAVGRIISPTDIHYSGMLIFAVVGVIVNLAAALITRDGDSINQKAVNLHMLEDVLGWVVVLIGAIVMKFTDIKRIDPIMSICVAIFIFRNAFMNLKESLDLLLEKTPRDICVNEIKACILQVAGVTDVHHIHIWSIDGRNNCATMHIVTNSEHTMIKKAVREELQKHGIGHLTLELESESEHCTEMECNTSGCMHIGHHHHHHH